MDSWSVLASSSSSLLHAVVMAVPMRQSLLNVVVVAVVLRPKASIWIVEGQEGRTGQLF